MACHGTGTIVLMEKIHYTDGAFCHCHQAHNLTPHLNSATQALLPHATETQLLQSAPCAFALKNNLETIANSSDQNT